MWVRDGKEVRNAFPPDAPFPQAHRRSVKKTDKDLVLGEMSFWLKTPFVTLLPSMESILNRARTMLSTWESQGCQKKVLIKLFDWVVNKLCSYYSPCPLIQRPNETLGPTRVKHKGRSFCFSNPPIVSSQIDLSYMFCPWSIFNNLEKDIWRCLKSFTVPFVKL